MAKKNGVLIFSDVLLGSLAIFFAVALYSLKDRKVTLGADPSLDVIVTEQYIKQ